MRPAAPIAVFLSLLRWLGRLPPVAGIARFLAGRSLVVAIPYLWLLVFFLVPFLIVLKISFSEASFGQPPYLPLWSFPEPGIFELRLNFENYRFLLEDPLYRAALLESLRIAAVATLICLLVGYPMAYGIARARPGVRLILLLLIILPFWTSFLIRVYAWIGILKNNGLINNVLLALGWIESPLPLLHSEFAVYVGIVYSYLPFMVLPLYVAIVRLDRSLLEAATDLGARPLQAFWQVTLPLTLPGVIAGSMLVFIPAVGEFVIPDLLGGPDTLMVGKVLWTEFFNNRDWPLASALAAVLVVLLVVPLLFLQRLEGRAMDGEKQRN